MRRQRYRRLDDSDGNQHLRRTASTTRRTTSCQWRPAASAWTGTALARIRAIRIGIVVRSDEPDLKDPALVGQTAVLFDCSTHNAACQGRTVLNNTVLTDGFRFRTYETIVPMINAIYNDGL